jgi:hypothetical protein
MIVGYEFHHERGGGRLRALVSVLCLACLLSVQIGAANATGTARIQQRDGAVKTYRNVRIRIENKSMSITSSDGKGTIIISKAACSMIGKLVRCLPIPRYSIKTVEASQS